MTIDQALKNSIKKLQAKKITTAQLDAEVLLAYSLKRSREYIIAHSEEKLTKKQLSDFQKLISRRAKSEPIAYITKEKEFFGLDLFVDKNVLVPRPETELLVERAIERLSLQNNKKVVMDIGTGSGVIIISVAKNFSASNVSFFASDVSKKALQIAKKNAKKHNVEKKISFLHGDLLSPFIKKSGIIDPKNDIVILANLPYLEKRLEGLSENSNTAALKHEPRSALYSGEDGLDHYRELSIQIEQLKKNGMIKNAFLFCEIDHSQKNEMKNIFNFAKNISFQKDLAGRWRLAEIAV